MKIKCLERRRILLLVLLFGTSIFVFCNILNGQASGYDNISVRQAKNRLDADSTIFLLDVRSSSEYLNDGHIQGAVNINVYYLIYEKDLLPDENDTGIIVYCDTGARSKTAAEKLVEFGYTNVSNMEDGFNAWRNSGYPFIIGTDPSPTTDPAGINSIWILVLTASAFLFVKRKKSMM